MHVRPDLYEVRATCEAAIRASRAEIRKLPCDCWTRPSPWRGCQTRLCTVWPRAITGYQATEVQPRLQEPFSEGATGGAMPTFPQVSVRWQTAPIECLVRRLR